MTDSQKNVYSLSLRAAHIYMTKLGIDPIALLDNTDLSQTDLETPYRALREDQAKQYYKNLINLSNTPSIGLEIGYSTSLADLGTAGNLNLASKNIEELLEIALKNYELLYMHLTWTTHTNGSDFFHRLEEDSPLGELHIFLMERTLATFKLHSEELLGPNIKPTKLCLDYPDPGYKERYQEIFDCPIKFNQTHSELHFPKKLLATPISSYDPQVNATLKELCDDLLQKLRHEKSFIRELKLILKEKSGVFLNIEQAAERLDLSSRNLRRKLEQEGTSYQIIINEIRRELAIDYLTKSNMPIQQIADICGFSSSQNFAQAFKRWTNHSPSEYRKKS